MTEHALRVLHAAMHAIRTGKEPDIVHLSVDTPRKQDERGVRDLVVLRMERQSAYMSERRCIQKAWTVYDLECRTAPLLEYEIGSMLVGLR